MRGRLVGGLVAGGALIVGLVAVGVADVTPSAACPLRLAADETGCAWPRLLLTVNGVVAPKELPRRRRAPVAVTLSGRFRTTDATQPSALREVDLRFDRDVAIDATGLHACGRKRLEARGERAARRACRASIVGRGVARVAVPSARETPIPLPLTVFNGGVKEGITTLLVHSFAPAPLATPLIATVKLSEERVGRFGTKGVVRIPQIAAGEGSLLDFRLRVKRPFGYGGKRRSFATARCPDGGLEAAFSRILFRNEAKAPGVAAQTVFKGRIAAPCTPRRG